MMTTTRIRCCLAALLVASLIHALTACTPEEGGAAVNDKFNQSEPEPLAAERAGFHDPYDHESLLARPLAAAEPEDVSPELQAELARLPVPYDKDRLPVIYDADGKLRVAKQPTGPQSNLNASTRAIYVVGGGDWVTYYYIELPLPSYITDADGGTIRLIMQHEVDSYDQLRVIDEHIGTEYVDNSYGARGRFPGRYGWTRQSGGGDLAWILGDGTAHNLANPWDWAWILDYRWLQGNSVLGGDYIRVYSHPHVTTRVVFMD